MKKLILVTSAPAKSGLAYFHYLAFRGIPGLSVDIVDNGQSTYGRTLGKRIISTIYKQFNTAALQQHHTLLKLIGGSPDKTCVILYGMACLSPREIHQLNSLGVKLYIYISDSPFALPTAIGSSVISLLPIFRAVFVAIRNTVPVYYQNGAKNVLCVPFGYCRHTHFRSLAKCPQSNGKLYYFGTYGSLIEEWLAPLVKFPLVIHGHDWGQAAHKGLKKAAENNTMVDGGMADLASGQLVVNFMRTQPGPRLSMKSFELPAAGACVLTNRTEEQVELFPENSCVNYFNTIPEMVSLVHSLLNNPSKIAEAIKLRGTYLEGQSYHERVTVMFNEIQKTFREVIRL